MKGSFFFVPTVGAILIFSFSSVLFVDSLVNAQRGALRANVYVTQAEVPRNLSEQALIQFVRSRAAKQLRETTDSPLNERRWIGHMVVQFSAPIQDFEYHALFYDVTDGGRTFIDDMAINVHDRNQRTFLQRLVLPRPRFKPNRQIEVVITVRRVEAGKTKFTLIGEEEKRSGVVVFSDEEARARD